MRHTYTALALVGLTLMATSAPAQDKIKARGDTAVIVVKSPRGQEVTVSGTLLLRNLKTTRRFENVRTPFELRVPLHDFDADFRADDYGSLSGEMFVYKDSELKGLVTGTVYFGTVKLHHEPGGSFGFGGRNFLKKITP